MRATRILAVAIAAVLLAAGGNAAVAATVVVGETVPHSSGFNNFTNVPALSALDYADAAAGNGVTATNIGALKGGSGPASFLLNGVGQAGNDSPGESVFFNDGVTDGKFLLDLNGSVAVEAIHTYSRHTGNRTPQHYDVFFSNAGAAPGTGSDTVAGLEGLGWTHLTRVDVGGGSHNGIVGVSISDDGGVALGTCRHLLFNVDPLGGANDNAFYGEIDVVELGAPVPPVPPVPQQVFYIGVDNGNNSDFDHENNADDHYYWENGDYSGLGGANWSGGQEPWSGGDGVTGFDRALLTADPVNYIYFQLEGLEAAADAQFSFISDMVAASGSDHDLEFYMNGILFHTETDIGNKFITDSFTGADVGAQVGSNVIEIRRTNTGGGYVQFDYLSLEVVPGTAAADIPEPATVGAIALAVAGLGGYVRKRKQS